MILLALDDDISDNVDDCTEQFVEPLMKQEEELSISQKSAPVPWVESVDEDIVV